MIEARVERCNEDERLRLQLIDNDRCSSELRPYRSSTTSVNVIYNGIIVVERRILSTLALAAQQTSRNSERKVALRRGSLRRTHRRTDRIA